jgi:hypothetical protein
MQGNDSPARNPMLRCQIMLHCGGRVGAMILLQPREKPLRLFADNAAGKTTVRPFGKE